MVGFPARRCARGSAGSRNRRFDSKCQAYFEFRRRLRGSADNAPRSFLRSPRSINAISDETSGFYRSKSAMISLKKRKSSDSVACGIPVGNGERELSEAVDSLKEAAKEATRLEDTVPSLVETTEDWSVI
jgi:hypothetical protein